MKCHATIEAPSASAEKRSAGAARPSHAGTIQTKLSVGGAEDAYEQEAERTADLVTGASHGNSNGALALGLTPLVQRAPEHHARKDDDDDAKKNLQKKSADPSRESFFAQRALDAHSRKEEDDAKKKVQKKSAEPSHEGMIKSMGVPENLEKEIAAMSAGGEQLALADRAFYEKQFGQSFSDVRVHSGPSAQRASEVLNARAFTVGQHIFFGAGEYRPQTAQGRHLMAHELAHTIQQSAPTARAARQVQRDSSESGDNSPSWIARKIQGFASKLPGYRLFTIVLGRDPFTDEPVEATVENVVHGVLEFVPGGDEIFQHLQESKDLQRFAEFFHQQVKELDLTWDKIKGMVSQAWDSVSILHPIESWEKIKAIIEAPVKRVVKFAGNFCDYIIGVIKKKVLEWLRDWATRMRGYPLLTFILGKDPFTDEKVQRTPTAFIKAVLSLVDGGDKIFENLQKSHTIERTTEWLNQEIQKLDLSWEKIKGLFAKAWDVISISDLLHPLVFVDKIRDIFEAPALRVVNFALAVGKKVLEFIFEGVMMLAGPIGARIVAVFKKAGAVLSIIVADPVAFLGRLIDAAALGFKQFMAKIGEYLKEGLIAWLVGALEGGGIVLPKVWDLKGILSLALQIMGITYAKIRGKVVKALDTLGLNGEKIVSTAEKVWNFLVALVTDGPAAAWQKITETLGNFWDMVIGAIKEWAITRIIKVAVTKLLTMFNPVGAIIQAIIGIYNTVAFFVSRINQILALVDAITDSIANIAAGKIAAAANYVEKTLARTIPVTIGFLASLIGLGDISEGIRKAIESFQQMVDKAIDKAIEWIVLQLKKLFGKGEDKPHDEKWDAGVAGVKLELEKMDDAGQLDDEKLKAQLPIWKTTYGFSELEIDISGEERTIDGAMSPGGKVAKLGHLGTFSDPFVPFSYPKPKNVYEAIYLDDGSHGNRAQPELKAAYDDPVQRSSQKVNRYVPFPSGSQKLPDGTDIGIRDKFVLSAGDKIGPLKEGETPGGYLLSDKLSKYGYLTENRQADHVWEMQYGGENVRENLWPLETGLNSRSGNYLKNLEVTMPSGKEKKVSELKANERNYWFKITSFKQP